MTKITRRDFLKGLAVAGTAAVITDITVFASNDPASEESDRPYHQWQIEGAEWGMVIDLAKCDGCTDLDTPACTQACIDGHYTPDDHEYIKVFSVVDNDKSEDYFFPRPCQQCRDPPCVQICPVGAAWQRDGDRLTLIDQSRCIGCRLCMAACPYEVRFFHWGQNPKADDMDDDEYENQMPFSLVKDKGVTAKCEFCGLQFLGQLPHCVSTCPQGALYFGDMNENSVTNSKNQTLIMDHIIKERSGFRWKEEEGTKPRVYYLPAGNGGQ